MISHDLGVIHGCCDRVAVCYAGKIVESGPCQHVLRKPAHPYTKALAAAIPRTDSTTPELDAIPGQAPRLNAPWTPVPLRRAAHPLLMPASRYLS